MANLVEWVENTLRRDEYIEAVVIGPYEGQRQAKRKARRRGIAIPEDVKGTVLDWGTAKRFLNYEFDSGYGASNCHAIFVWTNKRVLFICLYDGRTWLCSVPRSPQPCTPQMMGA